MNTDLTELCQKAEEVLAREPRLIRLPSSGKVVFVGDTHGDIYATEKVMDRYLRRPYRIVFLGDYVDRGSRSEENIYTLLTMKVKHPEEITLLAGNHEGFMVKPFLPANFWESLPTEDRKVYGHLFSKLPVAATSANGVLALHGGLPDLGSLDEVDQITWGDENWNRMTWGDFLENEGNLLGDWGGRPQFGRKYFRRAMDRYEKKLLIRSHQPSSPQWMFNQTCLTIFTSHAYKSTRTVGIVDLENDLRNGGDVVVETL